MRASEAAGALRSLWRDVIAVQRGPRPIRVTFTVGATTRFGEVYGGQSYQLSAICYQPPPVGRPGVLLLHTAGGLTVRERAFAIRLDAAGFITMVTRYTPRTSGNVIFDRHARSRIDELIAAALVCFGSHPGVDPDHIAVFGLSLGGHFAVRLAASELGSRLAGIVVWYGVYPATIPLIERLHVPLLIVQGDRDAPAFVSSARSAAAAGSDRVELLELAGAPHRFDVVSPGADAAECAWMRTVTWLRCRAPSATG